MKITKLRRDRFPLNPDAADSADADLDRLVRQVEHARLCDDWRREREAESRMTIAQHFAKLTAPNVETAMDPAPDAALDQADFGPDQNIRDAIRLIGEARRSLTLMEFQHFIRNNVKELGGHGFLCSIGQAILDGATIEGEVL